MEESDEPPPLFQVLCCSDQPPPLAKICRTVILQPLQQNVKHQCLICFWSYRKQETLQQHYELVHVSRGRLVCHVCRRKRFDSSEQLIQHIRQAHPALVNCDQCGRPLANEVKLASHAMTHETRQPKNPLECVTCHKIFDSRSKLRRHRQKFRKRSAYRDVCCDICHHYLPSFSVLQTHRTSCLLEFHQ